MTESPLFLFFTAYAVAGTIIIKSGKNATIFCKFLSAVVRFVFFSIPHILTFYVPCDPFAAIHENAAGHFSR